MEIRRVAVEKINPAEYNPRKDLKPGDPEYESLRRSIDEFGLVEPLVWNEVTGNLVGGHQRFKILLERGATEVEVSVVHLDPDHEKALNIALNKIQGDWDYAKLKDVLEELETKDIDVTLSGFSMSEIDRLLAELGDKQVQEEEEPQVEERAQVGDLWALGEHRVICADCTDKSALERLLGNDKVNVIVTSPPYAEQRKNEYGGVPAEEYPAWFGTVANTLKPYLADTGSFFVNIKEHAENGQRSLYVIKMVLGMVEKYGWRFVDELIWVKPGLPGGWANRLRNDFEPVYWFTKNGEVDVVERYVEDGPGEEYNLVDEYGRVFHFSKQEKITFYPKAVGKESKQVWKKAKSQKTSTGNVGVRGYKDKGIARPGNVIKLTTNNEVWKHPAMYPVELPEFFIKLTTVRGEKVMDPFLGSGSTLMAAEKTKRVCYGIEYMPKYVDIILARWEKATGQKAVRLSGD